MLHHTFLMVLKWITSIASWVADSRSTIQMHRVHAVVANPLLEEKAWASINLMRTYSFYLEWIE
jgi:hypothetical protein